MEKVTIIATSLKETSNSQKLGRLFKDHLDKNGIEVELFDLREMNLPMTGAGNSWDGKDVSHLSAAVSGSSHIVFAMPIYCYDVNAAAKNVIELIGKAFTHKVISFICAAGGMNSYMAVMGLANHLMLDFRSIIVPRFLYTTYNDWEDDGSLKPDIQKRLEGLLSDMQMIEVNQNYRLK